MERRGQVEVFSNTDEQYQQLLRSDWTGSQLVADYEAKLIVDDLQEVPIHSSDWWQQPYDPTAGEVVMYRGAPAPPSAPTDTDIGTITVLSPTSLKVEFTLPIKNNVVITMPEVYKITPYLEVISVTAEDVAEPTYGMLTTAEQKDGESYTIEIQRVEEA